MIIEERISSQTEHRTGMGRSNSAVGAHWATIGCGLMVQHYIEDIATKDHRSVLSTSDVLRTTGWTTTKVLWELSVKAIDKETPFFAASTEKKALEAEAAACK